jgi:hypothetical protein
VTGEAVTTEGVAGAVVADADVRADLEDARALLRRHDGEPGAEPDAEAAARLYAEWFQTGGSEGHWPEGGAYAAATAIAERFEAGWSVATVRLDGLELVHDEGRVAAAQLGEVAPLHPTAPIATGARVRRLARSHTSSPGFWHLFSDGWQAARPERLTRVYLPLLPDAMLHAAEVVTRVAPPDQTWAAKFLRGASAGPRRDPGLLYLPVGHEAADWVRDLLHQLAPVLTGPRVRLTTPWHGGWRADDPGGDRSYGQALTESLVGLAGDHEALSSSDAFRSAALVRLRPLLGHLAAPA